MEAERLALLGGRNALKSSCSVTWKSVGRLQRTLGGVVEVTGTGLHSGKLSTVRLKPELAGRGRSFCFVHINCVVPALVEFARESLLCTALEKDGVRVRTVEHLLSALEGVGVDNCKIEVVNLDSDETDFEVPILDGSAKEWVEEIERVGMVVALDEVGRGCERMVPVLNRPVQVRMKESFMAAFPLSSIDTRISYGIDFPQVSDIGSQWFTLSNLNDSSYIKQVAPARTFCVYEEVERMRSQGLIKGGSLQNAIVCSTMKGWLNPPLRFSNEPCRHKVLDVIGDLSLFARRGNQGLPAAHIVSYKGGHSLHANFVRCLESHLMEDSASFEAHSEAKRGLALCTAG